MEEPPLIYLDNAATTRVAPEVFEAMTPFLQDDFGNPSSIYSLAGRSASAIDPARASVAEYIGARPDEIIFTGGGSEADNLAIKGTMWKKPGGHMITSAIEHHAVLHSCQALAELIAGGGSAARSGESRAVTLTPLVDTRSYLIVRGQLPEVRVDWDATPLLFGR